MKPASFDYTAPGTVEEVLGTLAEAGGDASVLAGGQSLVPLLSLRVARPELVVDVNRADGLDHLRRDDGELVLGALVRQQQALTSELVREACPLLAEALPFVGARETRLRGTVIGSMTHADPAGEIPTAAVALDAQVVLRSQPGSRTVAAREFFLAPFFTVRQPDELAVEIRFPARASASGWAFLEVDHGPLAVVAAAAGIELDGTGLVSRAFLGLGGVGPVPVAASAAEEQLRGGPTTDEALAAAAEAATADLDPPADMLASSAYRGLAARQLLEDALRLACRRAEAA